MQNFRKITDQEYVTEFQPTGVWILIEKDIMPEKTSGGIIVATKGRENAIRHAPTGVIRAMAPIEWSVFEQPQDAYWRRLFRVGDHVGYNSTTPVISPSPVQWEFECGDVESTKFIQIVITDITGIFLHTEEQRKEWLERVRKANEFNFVRE